MKEIDTSTLLTQLRMNAAVAKSGLEAPQPLNEAPATQDNFAVLLKQSIDKVNELQKNAGEVTTSFELGDPTVSLAEVMIAKQKASIAFESVIQVRNKLANAYKEVMSMQV